mgnify:FL=1
MLVFSGFLIALESVFNWLRWLQWLSAVRYSFNVLIINEFRNIQFCHQNYTDICPMNGHEVLKKQSLNYEIEWDLWKYFFALTMMTLMFFFLAFFQLFRIKKTK